ncbi:hypothetical protein BH10BDE1_BH10BDE1_12270 [soil metagenome]
MQRANQRILFLAIAGATLAFAGGKMARADDSPTCSSEFFQSSCHDDSKSPLDLRKSTSEANGVLFNYSLILQPDKTPLVAAFNTMPGKELQDRGLRVANETRAAAIRYVSGGAPESSWAPQVRIAVERLRLLKFRLSEPDSGDCFSTGDPGIPNAQYRYNEHVIGICPALLKIPTAELAATLAHEIGHSVSPCMMSKPLVKYIGANRDYGVDMNPEGTDELEKTNEALRVPSSQIGDPPAYRTFNSCLDARYKTDYENWLSASTLRIEKMPRTLSPAWQKRIDDARAATPQRCYEKAEEHFADAFGSFAYDQWATTHELSRRETSTGLHFLINTKCAHEQNPGAIQFENNHASDADRLSLFLKPSGTAARVGCAIAKDALCSLSTGSYSAGDGAAADGAATQGSGTKP